VVEREPVPESGVLFCDDRDERRFEPDSLSSDGQLACILDLLGDSSSLFPSFQDIVNECGGRGGGMSVTLLIKSCALDCQFKRLDSGDASLFAEKLLRKSATI
jgi:hypothetical protein